MTVPFEGAGIPPVSPEQQLATDFTDGYRRMLTEKYHGDVWDESHPNGARVARLETTVWDRDLAWQQIHPSIGHFLADRLPVTITDNGPDTTRPLLEITIPKGLEVERGSWSDSGVLQVGRDGSFTFQSYDQDSGVFENRVLSITEVSAIQRRFNKATLSPKRIPLKPYINEIQPNYDGIFQWDEGARRPGLRYTGTGGLLDAMLKEISQNNRLHTVQEAASQEWLAAWPEVTEGVPVETFRGYGDDRLIDQVHITKPSDFPENSARGYTGSFDSDHTPVDSVFGLFMDGDAPALDALSPDKFDIINKSRIKDIDPDLLINRRAKDWTQFPDFPTRKDLGDEVYTYIPDGMFRRTEEPEADPGEQTLEDK